MELMVSRRGGEVITGEGHLWKEVALTQLGGALWKR